MKKFPAGNYAAEFDGKGSLEIPESLRPAFDTDDFLILKNKAHNYPFLSICFLPYTDGAPGKDNLKKIPIPEELRNYAKLSGDASMVSYSSYAGLIEIWDPANLEKYNKHIKPLISRYIQESANY